MELCNMGAQLHFSFMDEKSSLFYIHKKHPDDFFKLSPCFYQTDRIFFRNGNRARNGYILKRMIYMPFYGNL